MACFSKAGVFREAMLEISTVGLHTVASPQIIIRSCSKRDWMLEIADRRLVSASSHEVKFKLTE